MRRACRLSDGTELRRFGVAARMGMTLWKETNFKGLHVHVMRLLRKEFLEQRLGHRASGEEG